MAVVYAFLYVPLLFMMVLLNSTRQDANFHGLLLALEEGLTKDENCGRLWLSLQVAAVTGVLSAILGTFAAFVLVRYRRFSGAPFFPAW